ncbi:MAG: O-antigen ligase family protein [Ignavibacteriales bacterium]|nr:O-antigen ligase family protein [Ignavibacteriales bacterium]MCF8315076.1 O-antigen ligase family protein [Ignavibacteriales bacterium]MCF8435928.1 O-antigen ligase family protein [Ignavibacteriales bacterium]
MLSIIDRKKRYLLPTFLLFSVMNSVPQFKLLHYFAPLLGILILYLFRADLKEAFSKNRAYSIFLLLPFFAILSSFWSPDWFMSFSRGVFLLFITIAGLLSGLLSYKYLRKKNIFLPVNIVVIMLSIISILFDVPEGNWKQITLQAFRGFAFHPNTLGALILFSLSPQLIFWYESGKKIHPVDIQMKDQTVNLPSKLRKILSGQRLYLLGAGILILLNLFVLSLSFSRASILSLSVLFFLLLWNFYVKKILLFVLAALTLFIAFYFILPQTADFVLQKYYFKGTDQILHTRQKLWEDSFKAAENGGLIGLGFGVSDPTIQNPIESHPERGIREKGNSTLAVIEEIGIIGLSLFFLPFLGLLREIYRKGKLADLGIRISLFILVAFFIHSNFEGWFVGVASFNLLFFYVITGILIGRVSAEQIS